MSYISITYWETTEWTDEMEAIAREKYVPLVMAVGATKVQMVRTGENNFYVVTEYADEATAKAAQTKIDEIRATATTELPMTVSRIDRGPVFASG